jgi:hypothetical protein
MMLVARGPVYDASGRDPEHHIRWCQVTCGLTLGVPVTGHGQGAGGQNGALSSKKTTTGITAQPTMS